MGTGGLFHNVNTSITQGLSAVWLICFGYIPIGLAMEVLGEMPDFVAVQQSNFIDNNHFSCHHNFDKYKENS